MYGCLEMLPPRNYVQHPTIHCDDLSIDVQVLRQKYDRLCHLFIATWSLRWHMSLLLHLFMRHVRFLTLITLLHGHFAWKVPRGNAVHPDVRLLELRGHKLCKMDRCALGSVVREMTLGVTHNTAHGGDDDDGGGAFAVRFDSRL